MLDMLCGHLREVLLCLPCRPLHPTQLKSNLLEKSGDKRQERDIFSASTPDHHFATGSKQENITILLILNSVPP